MTSVCFFYLSHKEVSGLVFNVLLIDERRINNKPTVEHINQLETGHINREQKITNCRVKNFLFSRMYFDRRLQTRVFNKYKNTNDKLTDQ